MASTTTSTTVIYYAKKAALIDDRGPIAQARASRGPQIGNRVLKRNQHLSDLGGRGSCLAV